MESGTIEVRQPFRPEYSLRSGLKPNVSTFNQIFFGFSIRINDRHVAATGGPNASIRRIPGGGTPTA